jgi:hypothetical protein
MAAHSNIVGGSTAKRVIACPGSVALVQKMPPKPSSKYADEGTLLHHVIAAVLETGKPPEDFLGTFYNGVELTEDRLERKLLPALAALDEIDPDKLMEYDVEKVVGFGHVLPGVFGSADLVGRIGDRGILVDWKFGDGVAVEAEENPQALFYIAAALHTTATAWAFRDTEAIDVYIVQPPYVKKWTTDIARVKRFEAELILAVRAAEQPDAPLKTGDHCRWCAAKSVCPLVTGAVERADRAALKTVNVDDLAAALDKIETLEGWIKDAREMAQTLLENGVDVPGYKLVAKRATRQWVDEDVALTALTEAGLNASDALLTELRSPAQIEKMLKKHKIDMPEGIVVSVSTGNTLASADDPRPAVLQIGKRLASALGKLV